VTDCGISAGSAVVQCNASSSAVFIRVWVHKNKNGALTTDSHTTVVDSVIVNGLTGGANVGKGPAFISGGDAFQIVVTGNLIYGHNSDGLFFSDIRSFGKAIVQSNIIAKNGGWGINVAVAGTSNFPNFVSRNFFYGNTSGVISNSYAIDSTNITVSVNPFNGNETNLLADTDYDFSLNSATTGGALIRNAGAPGSIASMPTAVGYRDGGPLNHQEALRGTMI
jgi:hypothetical protein